MAAPARLRLLGVAVADVSDWSSGRPTGKWSQLFSALSRRYELLGVIQAELPTPATYLNLALHVRPSKRRWRAAAGFNLSLVRRRTSIVQAELDRRLGSYDAILQLQTLCEPGRAPRATPYTIYTDTTMALTRRLFPAGARIPAAAARRWTDFEAAVCRSAHAVFTTSEFARASMVGDYGCAPERVRAVGGGVNQYLEELAGKRYDSARALFVGVDFARKGGLDLLAAWPEVRDRVPGATLTIAGPRRAPGGQLPTGVEWVGRVDRKALTELYAAASVFVLPSRYEPWGFVFYEAMGHGLACVAASCCAMPEMVQEGVTGALVAPGDRRALAGALADLLADPDAAERMGRAAHARVLAGHRWDDVVERIAAGLESVALERVTA